MKHSHVDDVCLDDNKCIDLSTSFRKSFSERVKNGVDKILIYTYLTLFMMITFRRQSKCKS